MQGASVRYPQRLQAWQPQPRTCLRVSTFTRNRSISSIQTQNFLEGGVGFGSLSVQGSRSVKRSVASATSRDSLQEHHEELNNGNLASLDVDVAIVGGGPGGLAVAAALSRVLSKGTTLKVFESSPAVAVAGAGVSLHVNGMRALEAIHPTLAHRLYDKGSYMLRIHQYDESSGQEDPAGRLPVSHDRYLGETGHSSCLVYWNDLRAAIKEYVPEGALEFGCRLKDCELLGAATAEQHGNTAEEAASTGGTAPAAVPSPTSSPASGLPDEPYRFRLTMERRGADVVGDLRVRAKYVIGADGYFSRVRRQLGDGHMPDFSGLVCWRGSFTPQQLAQNAVPLPAALSSPAGRVSSHRWTAPGAPPMAPRLLLLYLADEARGLGTWYMHTHVGELAAAGVEYPPASAGVGGLTGAEALSRGLRVFSHLPADVRALLAATHPDRVTEHGLYMQPMDRIQPGAWTGSHFALLGDAAHATLPDGQGACLALEDAVVLAECVRRHGGRLGPKVLAEWEALRQPRVRRVLSAENKPPFTERLAAILGLTPEPLWRPEELPVRVGSVEEGLAWSRGVVRETVEGKVARARTAAAAEMVPVAARGEGANAWASVATAAARG